MQIAQKNDCAMKDTKNSSINVKTGMTIITDSEMSKKLFERLKLMTADERENICKKKIIMSDLDSNVSESRKIKNIEVRIYVEVMQVRCNK